MNKNEAVREAIELKGLIELKRVFVKSFNAKIFSVTILTEKGNRLTLDILGSSCILKMNINGHLLLTTKHDDFQEQDVSSILFEGKIDTLPKILEAANNGLPINLLVYSTFIVDVKRG